MFGNFLYYDSLPGSFVSLFIFYILSYLLSKAMGYFFGHLMSSASDQKLFYAVCSAFKCSFDEFVGEKVVSPSYSSAILAPPHSLKVFLKVWRIQSHISSFTRDFSNLCFLYFPSVSIVSSTL